MCFLCAKILPIIDNLIAQIRVYKLGFRLGSGVPKNGLSVFLTHPIPNYIAYPRVHVHDLDQQKLLDDLTTIIANINEIKI